MELVCIGEIVNTHGIKGEIKVISEFKFKEEVFKKGFVFYIGRFKDKLVLDKYRKHKIYDMLIFEGITNINEVIIYKGEELYINREDLKIDGYLNEDLIGFSVSEKDNFIGYISDIINNNAHDILIINNEVSRFMIPFVDEFVKEIDFENKKVKIEKIEGLIDEN